MKQYEVSYIDIDGDTIASRVYSADEYLLEEVISCEIDCLVDSCEIDGFGCLDIVRISYAVGDYEYLVEIVPTFANGFEIIKKTYYGSVVEYINTLQNHCWVINDLKKIKEVFVRRCDSVMRVEYWNRPTQVVVDIANFIREDYKLWDSDLQALFAEKIADILNISDEVVSFALDCFCYYN